MPKILPSGRVNLYTVAELVDHIRDPRYDEYLYQEVGAARYPTRSRFIRLFLYLAKSDGRFRVNAYSFAMYRIWNGLHERLEHEVRCSYGSFRNGMYFLKRLGLIKESGHLEVSTLRPNAFNRNFYSLVDARFNDPSWYAPKRALYKTVGGVTTATMPGTKGVAMAPGTGPMPPPPPAPSRKGKRATPQK